MRFPPRHSPYSKLKPSRNDRGSPPARAVGRSLIASANGMSFEDGG
jgi:hypothetical protein